jgi:hypothetical protein
MSYLGMMFLRSTAINTYMRIHELTEDGFSDIHLALTELGKAEQARIVVVPNYNMVRFYNVFPDGSQDVIDFVCRDREKFAKTLIWAAARYRGFNSGVSLKTADKILSGRMVRYPIIQKFLDWTVHSLRHEVANASASVH